MAHSAFSQTDHRPWPCPDKPWFMRQTWCDLAFVHWPVPASILRSLVPAALEIEEYGGTSWVGVVPFRMVGVSPRFVPDVPGLSAFPEINLRLYVSFGGKPGVWFLSLVATNSLAVWAAKRFFHLPYFKARITVTEISAAQSGTAYDYRSIRLEGDADAEFAARYGPTADPYQAEPGTLEHWLTERYCLYAEDPSGHILRTDVHHKPWPLQSAEISIEHNELGSVHGLDLSGDPELVHFSRRIDVVAWLPEVLSD